MKYAKYHDKILEIHGESDALYLAGIAGNGYLRDTAYFISKSHIRELEPVMKIADSMDALFDAFVALIDDDDGNERHKYYSKDSDCIYSVLSQIGEWAKTIYGAIWTNEGLKYVAKFKNIREWELL